MSQHLQQSMQGLSMGASSTSPSSQTARVYQHSNSAYTSPVPTQTIQSHAANRGGHQPSTQMSRQQSSGLTVASLTPDVQVQIGYLERRFIKTDPGTDDRELLDKRKYLFARGVTQRLQVQVIDVWPNHTTLISLLLVV